MHSRISVVEKSLDTAKAESHRQAVQISALTQQISGLERQVRWSVSSLPQVWLTFHLLQQLWVNCSFVCRSSKLKLSEMRHLDSSGNKQMYVWKQRGSLQAQWCSVHGMRFVVCSCLVNWPPSFDAQRTLWPK